MKRICVNCGACVLNCPVDAWTRSEQKYYRLTLLGRTGKKNPCLGEDFIKWALKDVKLPKIAEISPAE